MQRWEYFTTTFGTSVEATPIPVRDGVPTTGHGKYSPYTLIPQLNELGSQGWELVSIDLVAVGKQGDYVVPDANASRWGRHFFCCFKRAIEDE